MAWIPFPSYHKLLLRASHAGASLCVLVCSDQQLDQSGNGPLLSEGSVVGRAQGQVTDQTHCGLPHKDLPERRELDGRFDSTVQSTGGTSESAEWEGCTLMRGQWDGGCSNLTTTGRP